MAEAENKKRILVVEDESKIAITVIYNLQRAGYVCELASDGEEGLKKALSGNFDLILLDIMLPKMNGFEVCKRIREKLGERTEWQIKTVWGVGYKFETEK